MAYSKEFVDDVISYARKGVRYNSAQSQFELDLSLGQDGIAALKNTWNKRGYNCSEDDIRAVVGQFDSLNQCGEFSLGRHVPGQKVVVERQFEKDLNLLYLGGASFLVCKDSYDVLYPKDKIMLMDGGLCKNRVAYFKVFRDGERFPSIDSVYRLDDIVGIKCSSWIASQPMTKGLRNVRTSEKKIFAWRSFMQENYSHFSVVNLTDNEDAIFELDLVKNEFRLNSKFSPLHYAELKMSIHDVLSPVCVISKGSEMLDWHNVELLSPGKFDVLVGGTMRVTKKMEVRL